MEKEICEKYLNGSGLETLCSEYHMGKLRIKQILTDNGVPIRGKGNIKQDITYKVSDFHVEKYPVIDGYHYIAVDRNNRKTFNDYNNAAGCLTTYINKTYGIKVPTLYERRKYYMVTGNYWWEQWFEIKSVKNAETKKCPYCDWETIDVENKSGMFLTHLWKCHGITKEEHLEKHPEDYDYLRLVNPTLERQFEKNEDNYVTCAICGKKLARIDWRHLEKHGLTQQEYVEITGGNTVSKKLSGRLSEMITKVNETMEPKFVSSAENEIVKFIQTFGIKCEQSNRKLLHGKELDIIVPEKKVAIEYNGLFWHRDGMNNKDKNSHILKTKLCKEIGYSLIQIFEDEYVHHKEIVLNKIQHLLGVDYNSKIRIPARKCVVQEIERTDAELFLNKFHIQGFVNSSVYLGCFFNNELVGVMTFKYDCTTTEDDTVWELNRFASNINYVCQGVGGKLFSYFVKNYNPYMIKSFADRRWTINENDNLYTKIGFKLDKYTKPDYRYYNPRESKLERQHKFNFRKNILHKKYGFPLTMTEDKMTQKLGYSKIYDCGLIKYVWEKQH